MLRKTRIVQIFACVRTFAIWNWASIEFNAMLFAILYQ